MAAIVLVAIVLVAIVMVAMVMVAVVMVAMVTCCFKTTLNFLGSALCGALTSVNQTILNNNDVTTANHVITEECSTSSITTRDACVMYKRASDDVDDSSSISTTHDVTSDKISQSLTDLKLTSSDEVA